MWKRPEPAGRWLFSLGLVGALAQSLFPNPSSAITFVSVSQGDCTVIQDRGMVVVVDVGGRFEDFDVGGRLALPKLRQLGVRSIDLLVLTHPDLDHVGGLKVFARQMTIRRVAAPQVFATDLEFVGWLRQCGIAPESVHWMKPAESMLLPSGKIDFRYVAGGSSPNEQSLVTTVTLGETVAVLAADIGAETEQALLTDGKIPRADLLKVGHHGSGGSTTIPFLEKVDPKFAIVSCGRRNLYGHPHPLVMGNLKRSGATTYRTDRDGDITFWLKDRRLVPDLSLKKS